MDSMLKATLTDSERQHAAGLLDGEGVDLNSAITAMFADLSDPLLSSEDVVDLLNAESRTADVLASLEELLDNGTLESSFKTQRPFDPEGTQLYRSTAVGPKTLKLVALDSIDVDGRRRFQFTVNGRMIRSVARIDRLNALDNSGNQRNEIKKHVEKIASGIASGTQVPSPVLLVMLEEAVVQLDEADGDFDTTGTPLSFIKVRPFAEDASWIEAYHGDEQVQKVRLVVLELPYRKAAFDDEKSILLVDGQQRTAALSLVPIETHPLVEMAATAIITTAEDAKRVFQVSNDTVKISTDFSRALLASMGEPPGYLKPEKVRADACKALALTDPDSPFFGMVKHPGVKSSKTTIAYNSLFAVVSVFADGFPEDLVGTSDRLTSVVKRSFRAANEVWPDAWELKPSESKLVHGAGLRAVASLAVAKLSSFLENGHQLDDESTWGMLGESFERLSQRVVWTDAASAEATGGAKKIYKEQIDSRQNTSQDIAALSDFLRKESLDLDMKARAKPKAK